MSSFNGFNTVPTGALDKPETFRLHVPNSQVADFRTLLNLSPIGPQTWENSTRTREGGKYFGVTRDWLSHAKDTWLNDFDWRQHESHINSFPNFKSEVRDGNGEPYSIHFAALFSKKDGATPVIFMHGWPGCFLEFLPMLDLLRTRYTAETLPFHAVIPSLPGYGPSSGPPTDHDFLVGDAAHILNQLMVNLGFGGGYVAQGGDLGHFLARAMSTAHHECKALHVNLLGMGPELDWSNTEGLDAQELQSLEEIKQWRATSMAYALTHATRPSTIGLALSSSPIALLAWIGEKHLEWSDTDISLEHILEITSLYWFTSSLPRCIWPYRALSTMDSEGAISKTKPLGYSAFKDIFVLPKAWNKCYPNMIFRKDHTKGGHFAALEQPEAFLQDIEEFLVQLGPV